jgi:uncharacterized protein with ParB-like and HNH nuclease domain
MNITPNKLTISQLFGNQNEQFIVPSYQRRYAWKYAQYFALFEDISILKDNEGHLFGMLIIHTEYLTGGLNKPELVDGQQRITTLILLLLAIRDRYKELKNSDKVYEIEKMISCRDTNENSLPKLVLGDLDNDDFVRMFKSKDYDKIVNLNILSAYNYFQKSLTNFSKDELNIFYRKLTSVAVLIRLDVGMAQDAYKLFETINNRGLRLSPTDIIKNFILGHAAKIGKDELADVRQIWSEIIINLDQLDTDNFLRQYMSGKLKRKISLSKTVGEFKNDYSRLVEHVDLIGEFSFQNEEDTEDEVDDGFEDDEWTEVSDERITIQDYLINIRDASEIYKNVSNQSFTNAKINKSIKNLDRILSTPTHIFLMFYLQATNSIRTQLEVLRTLETFMLRRHICESRTGEHDSIFAHLLRVDTIDVDLIKGYLNQFLPNDETFIEYFPDHQLKGKLIERAKYMLEYIEYYKTSSTGEYSLNSGFDVHLEHIVPQNINSKISKNDFGDWELYLGNNALARHKKYVNKIGNMTLLAGSLNIGASNNPFLKKKVSYKISEILITKDLGGYSDFKFAQVDKRGAEFAEIASKIWKF